MSATVLEYPKKKAQVLILVDFENLLIAARDIYLLPFRFSIEAGFKDVIGKIIEDVGDVIGIFAFLPPDRAIVWGKD